MTAPRQVLRGATYLVTRRCLRRQHFLRPDRATNAIFRYLLAVAARRYRIRLHAFCVLSNHYHLVLTDPSARLPAFVQYLDGLVARAVNASHGGWESFWSSDSFSAVTLVSPQDVVDRTAYTLANPVAAGLVRHGHMWPGLWSNPEEFGAGPVLVERPKRFFDPKGSMPATEVLELTAPPGFGSGGAFREQVKAALTDREAAAARPRGGFLGAVRVLAQEWGACPKTREPRRQLRPRVASRDQRKRVEAIGRLVEFLRGYRKAWAARRRGVAGVVFPAGTYQLRIEHGVACAGAG